MHLVGALVILVLLVGASSCAQWGARPRTTSMMRPLPTTRESAATSPSVSPEMATTAPTTQRVAEQNPIASPPVERESYPPPGPIIGGQEEQAAPLFPRFSVTGTYMYGPVTGNVQIPVGGKVGTTAVGRPHLHELGIDNASIEDGELAVALDPNQEFFAGAQFVRLSGDMHLREPLVSHGVSFPIRTRIMSDVQLDWYRFGYRYRFVLSQAESGIPDITFTPWIDGLLWNFQYSLNGGRVGTASRSFAKLGVQVGGTLAWRPNGGPLSFEASLGSFPQTTSLFSVSTEQLLARYRFYHAGNLDMNASVGVAWEEQFFHDHQTLSNKITADFGPMVIGGLQISF